MPALPASDTASVTRSSASMPSATCSAVAGTLARSASTTGLRPTTVSGASGPPVRRGGAQRGGRARGGPLGPLGGRRDGPRLRVVLAQLGGRRRLAALERLPALAARADGRALAVRAGLARAPALAAGLDRLGGAPSPCVTLRRARPCQSPVAVEVAARRQRTPSAVSSSTTPEAARRSRIASAWAQSLRARASARASTASATSASTTPVELAAAGRRPLLHRVERQHGEHAADVGEGRGERRQVLRGQQRVARPHAGVHDRERLRHPEVVVERRGEVVPRGRRTSPGAVSPSGLAGVADERLDAAVRRLGVGRASAATTPAS